MITNEFAEATTEINIILKYLPIEDVEKIPIKLRKFFQKVESKTYIPLIDKDKPLEEQKLKEKTKDLLTILYRNYWCNDIEKKELDKILIENDVKYEQELRERYNPDKLFKNNLEENIKQTSLVEYKKESIIKRIFNRILEFFRRQ